MRYKPLVLLIGSLLIVAASGIVSASDTDIRVSPIVSPLAMPAHQVTIDRPRMQSEYIWLVQR